MAFGLVDILLTLALGVAILAAIKLFFSKSSSTAAVKKPSSLSGNTSSDSSSGDKPTMIVYFGSQSGTAENFAYDFAEESKTYGFDAVVRSCEELVPEEFVKDKFSVFVVATHGEGEATDDTQTFWEYITDANKDPSEYSNTFSVFALGNRQYRYFCAVGKRIDQELAKMGGERLIPMGVGDDDGTLEDDWETWRSQFWAAARLKFLNISATEDASAGAVFNAAYDVTFFPDASEQAKSYQRGASKMARFFCNPAKDVRVEAVPVTVARELRTARDGLESTAHVEMDLSDSKLTYRTADNLGVYPRNCHKAAGTLAKRLGAPLSAVFAIKSKSNSSRRAPVPATCSVEDALLYCLDVNAALRGKIPSILANYTSVDSERAKLMYFANDTQGKEDFHNLRYNWPEILEAFPGVQLPFAHFLELAPRMQPRYYTISSSSRVQPKQVAVTVSRFFADKPDQRAHVGVASDLLCRTIDEPKNRDILAFVRGSSFRLPMRAGTPIIMIGPGTGIAPFKAFVQEFYTRKENKYGETVLYFGCRNSQRDFLYKEELEQAKADGVLSQLHVALSREPGTPKTYVQDLIRQNGEETWALLNKGAYVFVCGATAMGNDVREIMCGLGHKYGGLTPAASEAFIDKLALQNKYVQELWSA